MRADVWRKTVAAVCLLVIGLHLFTAPAAAVNVPSGTGGGADATPPGISKQLDPSNYLLNQQNTPYTDPNANRKPDDDWTKWQSFEEANFIEKMIGGLIGSIAFGLEWAGDKGGGIVPVEDLAFGRDPASLQVFAVEGSKSEFDMIKPVYWGFFSLAWLFMIAVVVKAGLRISRGKSNPRIRSSIGETVLNLGIGTLLLCFSWFVVLYAAEWNILLCQWVAPDQATMAGVQSNGDFIVLMLIKLVLVCMSLYINIMYVLRKFMLICAVVLGPFVALSYAAGQKQPFSIWLTETLSYAFLPFSHAIVFSIYFRLQAADLTGGLMNRWWVPLVVLFMVIPVSAYFRRVFSSVVGSFMGVNPEQTSGGGMMGLAGMGRMFTSLAGSATGVVAGGAAAAIGGFKSGNLSGGGMGASGGTGGGAGGKGTASGMSALTANAGAVSRSASPAAINTGIGQVSPLSGGAAGGSGGKTAAAPSFGQRAWNGAKSLAAAAPGLIGGFAVSAASSVTGGGLDMASTGVTGHPGGYASSLQRTGQAVIGGAAASAGLIIGLNASHNAKSVGSGSVIPSAPIRPAPAQGTAIMQNSQPHQKFRPGSGGIGGSGTGGRGASGPSFTNPNKNGGKP